MALNQTFTITVNGSPTEATEGATIEMLIAQFRVADPGLVVEHNGGLVFPQKYATTTVSAGDRVEFVNCGFSG
jgi:thiamine biosynthesis protein ThiS